MVAFLTLAQIIDVLQYLMKFIELRTALSLKQDPIYLLYGGDNFLINKSIDLIIKTAEAIDITRYGEDISVKDIIFAANTLSMFGGVRVIIVRRCDSMLKELVPYFKNPNPKCILILTSTSDKEPIGVKQVTAVDCAPITGQVLLKLIAKQVQENLKNITEQGAILLAQYCNNNFARIDNEITKLVHCIDEKLIDISHIQDLVIKDTPDIPIYEFGNALTRGNLVEATQILENLRTCGTDEYAIFGGLVALLRRLYYSLSTNCENERVAKALFVNPYSIMYARRDNRHLTTRIAKLYKFALNLEYKIKSGQLSTESATNLLQMSI